MEQGRVKWIIAMTDLSTAGPIDEWPPWKGNEARRCVAHKKNGEQCRRHARRGTSVCDFHGAKAPQVQRKARQRIEEATDRMARELLGIATGAESESVRLTAIRDALDRGGITAKSAVELSATQKPAPWEEMMAEIAFDGIAQITQEESRALRGLPPVDALAQSTQEIEVVNAELLPVAGGRGGPERAVNPAADKLRALDRVELPGGDPAEPTATVALPPTSISYEQAAQIMRSTRLRTNPGRGKRRGH
jgi:hypothetical protein